MKGPKDSRILTQGAEDSSILTQGAEDSSISKRSGLRVSDSAQ